MKRIVFSVLSYLSLAVLISCSGDRALREAETLLETNPAAADSVLTSIPEPTSKRGRAWYAVLKTQADFKQRKVFHNDSLITIATDYYGIATHGSRNKRYHSALAWYSLGCVNAELDNDFAAINAYLKAKDLFPDTLVRYYALAEQKLGTLYLNRMMLKPAMQQFEYCKKNADRLNDIKMSNYVFYHMGKAALYSEDFDKADSIFESIIGNPAFSYSHQTASMFEMAKICLYHKRDYQKALDYVNINIKRVNDDDKSGASYSIKADIFYEMHIYDSAYIYYQKSNDHSTEMYTLCSNADRLAELSALLGDNEASIEWHKLYVEMRDSIDKRVRANDIEEMQFQHNEEMIKDSYEYNQKLIIILSFFSIIVAGFTFFSIYWFYKNREKKRIMDKQRELLLLEEEIKKSSVEVIETGLKDLSSNNPDTRKSLLDLYVKRLFMCNKTFQQSNEFQLLSQLKVSQKELNREEKNAVFKRLKLSYLESISDLIKEVPDIKENEILTLLLKYQKLSIKQLSVVFSITEDAVKKRLSRLSQRAPSDFIKIFSAHTID